MNPNRLATTIFFLSVIIAQQIMGGDSSDGGKDGDSTERIVIANGMDFDKRYFYEVSKRMSRDWDLRKLSLLGPPTWVIASILAILVLFRFQIPNPLSYIDTSAMSSSPIPVGWGLTSSLAGVVIVAAFLAWILKPVGGISVRLLFAWLTGVYAFIKRIFLYLRNLLNVLTFDVWQSLNYWHPFTSHLSGRDPLLIFQQDDDVEVSGIFSDGPHYNNIFISSIYLTPEGDLSLRQRLTVLLYGGGRVRKYLVKLGLPVVVVVAAVVLKGDISPGIVTTSGSTVRIIAMLGGGLAAVGLVAATISDYTTFNVRFRADSSGLSQYGRLLNEPESESPLSRGRRSLANSMSGYGLLYLSRFLADIFGDVSYDVTFDKGQLMEFDDEGDDQGDAEDGPQEMGGPEGNGEQGDDGQDEREATDQSPADAGDTEVRADRTGTNETSPADASAGDVKLPEGVGSLTDSHATAAASELLWSSIPPESVKEGGEDADITLDLTGVRYYAIRKLPSSWIMRRRTVRRLIRYDPDTYWGKTSKFLTPQTAGRRTGLRLPIKKFMSVRHELPVEAIENPTSRDAGPEDLLFFADSKEEEKEQNEDSEEGPALWDEDVIHCLFLGGGEHQQAINKLLLALKAEGYDNVDILENAFSADVSDDVLSLMDHKDQWVEKLRQVWREIGPRDKDSDDRSNPDEGEEDDFRHDLEEFADELGRQPTAGEVDEVEGLSLLKDDEDLFGSYETAIEDADIEPNPALFPTEYFVSFVGADESFRQEDDGFILFRHQLQSDDDQERWAHVIIGMSAVATKTGALYWRYLFQQSDEGERGFTDPANDDFGTFEEDVIYFISCPKPWAFEAVDDLGDLYLDTSWQDNGVLDFSVERDTEYDVVPKRVPDEAGDSADSADSAERDEIKKLGMEYYELDIVDAPLGP